MFLDELISNCIKLCQFFLYLDNDPKTRSTQHIFCCSVTKICVHSYITSKRIKLECPTTSQIKDNFKDFPVEIAKVRFRFFRSPALFPLANYDHMRVF